MTPPKNQALDRILKFCATSSRSAPSPPLRKGEVYCLWNFTRRAEQWYKEEAARQLTLRNREAPTTGRRRQPSRAAKDKLEAGDYTLSEDEVESLLASAAAAASPRRQAEKPQQGERPDLAPPQSPEACLEHFQARLGQTIHDRLQEQRARHERHGVRHTCTVGSRGWGCVDEEYCGHGLVGRCVAWVPRRQAHLRERLRWEMDRFFAFGGVVVVGHDSTSGNNNTPERLAELKKARAAALKAETMRRLAELEATRGAVAADAEMMVSPTLGLWPASPSPAFLREDVAAQRVELAGLVFAVDVCLGEPRVLML
ncbi:hypothetical protein Daus18300_009937 [Diaporthe australafricana]|uniref:Uncharacterized protein n=1 Tax=Diaporthe australafricana TaxID=127596 RepID=A0ABR3WC71_9PEZI